MIKKSSFTKGIIDGLPICFGYISVAFAFGIFAVENGLSPLQTILVSMTNVTSAGQLAGVPIITGGGTLIELAVSQVVINLRYALMSISLSQKFSQSIRLIDRFPIAFVNTDEVFAVAMSSSEQVSRPYMYGLIFTPWFGWTLGTAIGAFAGNILPKGVVSALGIAIYGMFIAIVVPKAKKEKPVLICSLFAIALSCAFKYLPFLQNIPAGFVIIICAVVASTVMALLFPIDKEVQK